MGRLKNLVNKHKVYKQIQYNDENVCIIHSLPVISFNY